MNLTKQEAMDKMCPFRSKGDKVVRCAADECVMWEWYVRNQLMAPYDEVPTGYCSMSQG
jgi:hypothetical protein